MRARLRKHFHVGCYTVTYFRTMQNHNLILSNPEQRLPKSILDKAIKSTNEFGWTQEDFLEVIEAAKKTKLAVIGGQVQYVFPDGTCELYWLSYDSAGRQINEPWSIYCERTAKECLENFYQLIAITNIEKEAVTNFPFLADKKKSGVDIGKFLAFILYFDDKETDLFEKQQSK